MKYINPMVVFGGMMLAGLMPATATAGVKGVITTQVEALSGTVAVTYSTTGTKPLETKVGYKVTIKNVGDNTVNNVVFKGRASVVLLASGATNPAESADFVEANDDNGVCKPTPGTPTEITCDFGQVRSGSPAKVFAVFFKGPVESAGNCFVPGGSSCEGVRFSGATTYSEGGNDNPGSAANDQSDWTVPNVPLGTANPKDVRSALAKSGGEIFTGNDAIPLSTFGFATKVIAPNPPVFSSASISLKKLVQPADNDQVQLCAAAGNFTNCYEAAIDVPGVTYPYMPGGKNYLTTLLRIDSSEVKTPFRAAMIKVYYDANPNPLPFCPADGVPLEGAPHCVVNNVFRYSNAASNGELRGDVQVEVHGLTNGLIRIR